MSTTRDRNWNAVISIATEHAGLKPHFQRLEATLYGCLSEIDDPIEVRRFLDTLCGQLRAKRATLAALRRLDGDRKSRGLR